MVSQVSSSHKASVLLKTDTDTDSNDPKCCICLTQIMAEGFRMVSKKKINAKKIVCSRICLQKFFLNLLVAESQPNLASKQVKFKEKS